MIAAESAPPQIEFVVEAEPQPPSSRPAASDLRVPDGCSVEEGTDMLVVECPDGGLEAHWSQSPAPGERLANWTRETMVDLKSAGVPMVMIGEPTCTVQDESVACTRVLGRSERGLESTIFLAVGPSPEGGSVEVICQWTAIADEPTYQGLCQQVLRRI